MTSGKANTGSDSSTASARQPPSLYDILEVSPQASAPTIRAAYKSLMQRYHPDRAPADPAAAQRQASRINAAYEVLSDPEQRRRYDAGLLRQPAPRPAPPRAPSAAAAPRPAKPPPTTGNRIVAAFVVVLSLLGIVACVGLWWWTTPPAEAHVGTVQYDPDSPVVQVSAQLGSLRDAQGRAQATLYFRTFDGAPFLINGQFVADGSSVVRYDCERRRYTSTQNQMRLPDGTVVHLADGVGAVTPQSASERAMELACAPWWRRWKLL